jgi:Fe-S cluster assembly ATP-binding protein
MKRSEMAQLLAQAPDLTLFDEPESGVDLDSIAVIGAGMRRLLGRGVRH